MTEKNAMELSAKNPAYLCFAAAILIALSALNGCSKGEGEGVPTGLAPTVDNLIEQGWERFEAADYDSAEALFTRAVQRNASSAAAYTGRGWSRTHLGSLSSAVLSHNLALVLSPGTALATDNKAGLAVAYSVMDEDSLAIVWANRTLEDAPEYQFAHDSRLTANVVHLVIAQCHLSLKQYYRAHLEVERLNPQFRAGLTTQQATTVPLPIQEKVAGRPVVVDSVEADEYTNNLVVVLSATESGGAGSFTVLSVQKRWTDLDPREARVTMGWEVTVEFAPDELLTAGTEVVVNYLYVSDYSRYLASLASAVESLRAGS